MTGQKRLRNNYMTVKLPVSLIEMIDEEVDKGGYTSRTDFIKYAVRRLIDQGE